MDAKEFLSEIKKLEKMIENKNTEKAQWKAIALSTTTQMEGEKVQTSRNPHRMSEAIEKCIDIETEIDRYIDMLIEKRKAIIELIEQLPLTEYDVLHKVYVQNYTLTAYADEHGKSYNWATGHHRKAIEAFQQILNELGVRGWK